MHAISSPVRWAGTHPASGHLARGVITAAGKRVLASAPAGSESYPTVDSWSAAATPHLRTSNSWCPGSEKHWACSAGSTFASESGFRVGIVSLPLVVPGRCRPAVVGAPWPAAVACCYFADTEGLPPLQMVFSPADTRWSACLQPRTEGLAVEARRAVGTEEPSREPAVG